MDSAQLSRVLRGVRPIPKTMPDFVDKVSGAIARIEAAEQAASEARRRVLAGEE